MPCARIFSNWRTEGKGRVLSQRLEWGKHETEGKCLQWVERGFEGVMLFVKNFVIFSEIIIFLRVD